MKSYLKLLPLISIALILSACGGAETATGEVSGNPQDEVTDPIGNETNNPPRITGTASTTASVGMLYSFSPSASDPDGDSLSFTASSLPAWATLDSASGTISGTPSASDVGLTGEIILTVSDGSAQASLAPFAITVVASSDTQVVRARITSGMDDVEEQPNSGMYVDSSDLELINDGGDQLVGLRFALPIPKNATITEANLRFTTDETSASEADLVIWAQASDDAEAFTTSAGNLSARASTLASVAWKPQAWNRIGESGAAQTSSDLSTVVQEVVGRSGWGSGHHLVLVVSGQGVRTAESYEGSASNAAELTVSYTTSPVPPDDDSNKAPTITGVPTSGATEGIAYSFTPSASDADGDVLTFAISNQPDWAAFDTQSGTLSGTPAAGDVGNYDGISISVSDGELSATLGAFSILVSSDNHAPVISGTPVTTVVEQSSYSFTPTASDADGDSLSFSITNKPSWAVFDTSTGNLSGTPGYDAAGTYSNIVISASDGSVSTSIAPFAITVADLNRPPVISGTPATSVAEGASYSFTPTASDVDGNSLTYSISNRPAWASFSSSTGTLSGIPGSDSAGSYSNIVISVTDGVASDSLAAFSISVADVNQAPVISGTPSSSVAAGSAYSFVPSASDADDDSLTFSVSNLPAWANFDSSNGSLSGTPQESDVGDYANIQISVSDGSAVVALTAFSISVSTSTVATGSIDLSWTAPSTRTDGSALDLSEIAGYVVYLGTSSNNLQEEKVINDGSAVSYTINGVELGIHYVAVTTFDSDGNVSSYSNIISKNVTN